MLGSCDGCGAPLIEIEHHGDRLTGCLACNLWQGDKSEFIVELEVEDWEALGKFKKLHEMDFAPQEDSTRALTLTPLPRVE
jgi:hypothetical protein